MKTPLAVLAVVLVGLGGLLISTPAAQATAYTSTGVRCSVVGTAGDDRLVGTDSRDVICGRGGDDTLLARGGNDLIDGGPGADTLNGEAGDDRLLGAGATDELTGGTGNDTLVGGIGGDDLSGTAGQDVLAGQEGNDDLDGGADADSISGGEGTNWCSTDPADTANRCVHDAEVAAAHELEVLRSTVDVTGSDELIRARVHITDDTGVDRVRIALNHTETGTYGGAGESALVEGTVRDGWWVATVVVPRWLEPGNYELQAFIRDRVGRRTDHHWVAPTVWVVDRNPDRSAPAVATLASPAPTDVFNVRSASQTVRVRARLTDDASGVWSANFCAMRPTFSGGYTNLPCDPAERVSGTANDGWWEGQFVIPEGAIGGDWNVAIWLDDRAHQGDTQFWMGPDHYLVWTDNGEVVGPNDHHLPDGAGRFEVIGTGDWNPPVLTGLTATPSSVDTLSGPATVRVSVQATDVEGVASVGASLHPSTTDDPSAPDFLIDNFRLVDGTRRDGTWRASITLPQGTPPGDYAFSAWVEDAKYSQSYVSASSPGAADPNQSVMSWDPKVTVQPAP